MPPHERQAFIRTAFAKARVRPAPSITGTPATAYRREDEAPLELIPSLDDLRPLNKAEITELEIIPSNVRPVLGQVDGATLDWLEAIAYSIVDYGERYVRNILKARGFKPSETEKWIKAAKQAAVDRHLSTDLEEHRAITLQRLDDIYTQARASLNLKAAAQAVKNHALVTGVIRTEPEGGMEGLARIARDITKAGGKMALAIDAGSPAPQTVQDVPATE